MDGVFNHVSPDFPYPGFYRNPADCPFTGRSAGTSPGSRTSTSTTRARRSSSRDVCLYWIDQFGIDGIRFDNTMNFYVPGDTHGLPTLLRKSRGGPPRGERDFLADPLSTCDGSAVEVTDAPRHELLGQLALRPDLRATSGTGGSIRGC